MKLTGFIIFYLFAQVLRLLPFTLLYGFSDFLSFILRKVIRYRKAFVLNNLSGSFRKMGPEDLAKISKRFYRNLADITLEGIKAFTMTGKQVKARYRIRNPEIAYRFLEAGKGVICVTGHYGNWEWGALSPPLQMPWKFVAFYKPVNDRRLDRFVRTNRSRFGTILAPIRETTKTFEENRGYPVIYLMAADQSPSNREMAYWVDFLGRDTAFLHGPEKHARINNLPVVFAAIRRIKRGFYELELSILAEDPSSLPDGEITKRYAESMESLIMEDPANWLWSHRRWKLSR
ncbi:MAG: lysophospholipid acyltransferase family protein [Bacteroidales bacterium]|jgi:KDO2-lipid IV(A) lauroyltransferase|nr:lysophospholipid acyltransferase family protein [Bacteroidales bacterium]